MNFKPHSRDYYHWHIICDEDDEPTDEIFHRFKEKPELTETVTLLEKLAFGMGGRYYLKNKEKAEQCLRDAIKELKITKIDLDELDIRFGFGQMYAQMVLQRRYDECCDLFGVFDNIAVNGLQEEDVLVQGLVVARMLGRADVTKKAVEMNKAFLQEKIERHFPSHRDDTPFNLACYFATDGNDENLMYKYIQYAVKDRSFREWDFNNPAFDAYRDTAKFKVVIRGGSLKELEAKEQLGKIEKPNTLEEAVALIAKLNKVADTVSSKNNIIATYFGGKRDGGYDAPAKVPFLDDIMKQFGKELPAESLVNLFNISYYAMYANYQVSLDAVGEINRRKDAKAQQQIADVFVPAWESYDAGHRSRENTAHDQLIDDYFPNFSDEALIYLLEKFDKKYLGEGVDGLAYLFVTLLKCKPADSIKQRAYKCFVDMYAEEGESDYSFDDFKDLFPKLMPLLPEDVKEKVKAINPLAWAKIFGTEKDVKQAKAEMAAAKKAKEGAEKKAALKKAEGEQAAFEQAVIDAGIGFAGTLIRHEGNCTLYLSEQDPKEGHASLYLFEPNGRVMSCYIYPDMMTKKGVDDMLFNIKKCFSKKKEQFIYFTKDMREEGFEGNDYTYIPIDCEYTVFSSGKQVDGTQQGDRIKIKWGESYIAGWKDADNLIIADRFGGKNNIESFRYIGYFSGNEVVFDGNCGLED